MHSNNDYDISNFTENICMDFILAMNIFQLLLTIKNIIYLKNKIARINERLISINILILCIIISKKKFSSF